MKIPKIPKIHKKKVIYKILWVRMVMMMMMMMMMSKMMIVQKKKNWIDYKNYIINNYWKTKRKKIPYKVITIKLINKNNNSNNSKQKDLHLLKIFKEFLPKNFQNKNNPNPNINSMGLRII